LHGEVEDIEELRVRLWLQGIGRWCLDMVDFLVAAIGSPPIAALLGGEEQGGNGMAREGGSMASAQPSHVSARSRHGGAGKA
jgi:hypothetical protein